MLSEKQIKQLVYNQEVFQINLYTHNAKVTPWRVSGKLNKNRIPIKHGLYQHGEILVDDTIGNTIEFFMTRTEAEFVAETKRKIRSASRNLRSKFPTLPNEEQKIQLSKIRRIEISLLDDLEKGKIIHPELFTALIDNAACSEAHFLPLLNQAITAENKYAWSQMKTMGFQKSFDFIRKHRHHIKVFLHTTRPLNETFPEYLMNYKPIKSFLTMGPTQLNNLFFSDTVKDELKILSSLVMCFLYEKLHEVIYMTEEEWERFFHV